MDTAHWDATAERRLAPGPQDRMPRDQASGSADCEARFLKPGQDEPLPTALAAGMPSALRCRVFPGEARQLSVLRRWLESLLPDCPARDDVACVATELGANAVRHTASGHGGWFAVEIAWQQSSVRVAVVDGGAAQAPEVIDDPAGEQGRGLLVVRSLSVRYGVRGDHRGRLVWADVPWAVAGSAGPAAPGDRAACEPLDLASAGLLAGHGIRDRGVMAAVTSPRGQIAGHAAACHHPGRLP